MGMRKLSVAIDEVIAREAAEAAEEEGLSFSVWLTRAAEDRLRLRRGLEAVHEWEAEHGAPSSEQLAQADLILDQVLGPRR